METVEARIERSPSEQRGNSGHVAKKQRGRPLQKGGSGNPGGRPAGLSALIRTETTDGKELVVFCLKVFRDERMRLPFRMDALQCLTEHGWRKPMPLPAGEVETRDGSRRVGGHWTLVQSQ
jgi:hypothetical protein